jgi:predicted dithiol-disulfide oxidoreductase (DUF899 family)
MKNKGGRQVPNCVPESVNEETASEIIKDLDKVKNDLLKKVDVLVAKKKKLYSDVDIESPMSADEKKLDKDIADLFSQINQLVLQKRSLKKESINEGRGVKAIQSDFNKTVAAIETELLQYKKTKGTPQEKKHIDNLKKLHPIKKKLEAELESAVSGLYRDAELKIED